MVDREVQIGFHDYGYFHALFVYKWIKSNMMLQFPYPNLLAQASAMTAMCNGRNIIENNKLTPLLQ